VKTARVLNIVGWAAVILSVVILLVFGTIRLADMIRAQPDADAFAVRYTEHPVVALLHIVPGLMFLVLAPCSFSGASENDTSAITATWAACWSPVPRRAA
jgi:hypothetical protein